MYSRLIFALLPLSLFAQCEIESQSMLYQADWLSKELNFEVAKAPPPLHSPQPQGCLDKASVWFTIDLEEIAFPAFDTLNQPELWDHLKLIGVEGIYLKGLKRGGKFRTGMGLDPRWGSSWESLSENLHKKEMVLIGDSLGNSTGLGADFCLALQNFSDYPGLYHLVEIESDDWKMLPVVGPSQLTANIPWLSLQQLHKKGYVPKQFSSYVKESHWNATAPVKSVDGKMRRWIYLKDAECDPVIDWLNPSFAGYRIAAADTLDSIYNLRQQIIRLDARVGENAKEMLALWARKLGGFTVLESKGGIDLLKGAKTDLMTDTLTRPALLHALIAEDAEALKLMYRIYLGEEIETKRLVHSLQPFDEFVCDWGVFLQNPKTKYEYYEEVLTGEVLRNRLMKQDIARTGPIRPTTWPLLCSSALGIKDFENQRDEISKAHLLLAFFYAMQPGVFSFSVSDLLGTLKEQTVNLMSSNEGTIYASLPGQLRNTKSFAMQLRKMIDVRKENGFASGELLAVCDTSQKGLIILIHRLKHNQMLQLLAVNFGKTEAHETLVIPEIAQTTAIDLMTGLSEKKSLESSEIQIQVPPLSGKVLVFQAKNSP